jgi:hypothetical protein
MLTSLTRTESVASVIGYSKQLHPGRLATDPNKPTVFIPAARCHAAASAGADRHQQAIGATG